MIVTCGSNEKCTRCRELGADAALNYREGPFAPRVLELTGGEGVDIVLDSVGAPYLERVRGSFPPCQYAAERSLENVFPRNRLTLPRPAWGLRFCNPASRRSRFTNLLPCCLGPAPWSERMTTTVFSSFPSNRRPTMVSSKP